MNQREANREALRLAALHLEGLSLHYADPNKSLEPEAKANLRRIGKGLLRLAGEMERRADPEARKPKPDPVHPDQMTIEEVL